MTPEQCRMARAGLSIAVREIAELADVSTNTITRLEKGEELKPRTLAAVKSAFEAKGAEFTSGPDGWIGVKIKASSALSQ